jgi:hypothetical protein
MGTAPATAIKLPRQTTPRMKLVSDTCSSELCDDGINGRLQGSSISLRVGSTGSRRGGNGARDVVRSYLSDASIDDSFDFFLVRDGSVVNGSECGHGGAFRLGKESGLIASKVPRGIFEDTGDAEGGSILRDPLPRVLMIRRLFFSHFFIETEDIFFNYFINCILKSQILIST